METKIEKLTAADIRACAAGLRDGMGGHADYCADIMEQLANNIAAAEQAQQAEPVARDVLMALKSLVAALNAAMPYMQTCEDGVGPDCTKQFQALIDGHAAIAAAEQAHQAAVTYVNLGNRTLELGPGLCVEGSPDGKMKVTCQFPHAQTWLPDAMTPDMMRAVQLRSELGAYAAANLAGAYDLFA